MGKRYSQAEAVSGARGVSEVVEPVAVPGVGLGFAVGSWGLVGGAASGELVDLPAVVVDGAEVSGG